MLNWVSSLTPEGRLDGAVRKVEAALEALGTEWFAANHETKLACGQFAIEAVRKLMPDYDLGRNLYSQFFFFATDRPATVLEEGAKQFSEIAAAAKVENPPLFIAMGSIGQLFSLFAINAITKREQTRQATGALCTSHSRTINDMIQYVLYHRAI
jgi:hypothetical protein